MKILLVDDEPDICKLIKTMVEPLGVEVRTSSDSREAALILERDKFDGIMLDVAMPVWTASNSPGEFAPRRPTSRLPSS